MIIKSDITIVNIITIVIDNSIGINKDLVIKFNHIILTPQFEAPLFIYDRHIFTVKSQHETKFALLSISLKNSVYYYG